MILIRCILPTQLSSDYEKAGVKLYLDGNPSDADHILQKCVREDAVYMADYIADEAGKVKEIRYDQISSTIPLEY